MWVTFPFDEVLLLTLTPMQMVIDDGFYFKFLFSFDQVRWWS